MNCAECEILVHALIDNELDAGHARDVEAHVASCTVCADKLRILARDARDDGAGEVERACTCGLAQRASRSRCLCLRRG